MENTHIDMQARYRPKGMLAGDV